MLVRVGAHRARGLLTIFPVVTRLLVREVAKQLSVSSSDFECGAVVVQGEAGSKLRFHEIYREQLIDAKRDKCKHLVTDEPNNHE